MNQDFMIYSVVPEGISWFTIGFTRDDVERGYYDALARGSFQKPAYRVVVKRKPS
jgi:hypothetical protein